MSTNYQEKLQSLLRELFQFDSADLDFGFYAVMNQKRDVIEKFISEDLPQLIKQGLEAVATQNRAELEASYERARQRVVDTLGEEAFEGVTLKDYPAGTPAGKAYLAEKEKLDKAFVPEDVEAQIYNDLYTFFARYYQDGDFISQRRYGASDKYAVPYNGEEVLLYWANFDQYYVKTGVHFQNYSFVVPGSVGEEGTQVQVRLTKVDVPRDNVKGDKRFFVYADDLPVEWDAEKHTLVIPMEYRPLTPEESGFAGTRNQQDKLLEAAYEAILAAIPNKALKARLMEVDPKKKTEKDRLMYHLNRYAAENSRDFFVHKDLDGFLRREFDYYLKAEVLRLEDIDFSDTIFAERKAAQLKTTRHIGEAIIRFLDQLERFQKQLFLKKKFVLQSDYCLTLDKIPAEKRGEFYPEILANERQLAEWKKLYGVTITAETNLDFQPHLMLDTAFFDTIFKHLLLSCFANLDDAADGLLVHGENFQALSLLAISLTSKAKCIHIDPPYNTASSGFLYKNSFQHSSWLSMMQQTHELAVQLIEEGGVLQCHIDEYEQERLHLLFEANDTVNAGTMVWNKGNPVTGSHGLATQHEYILWRTKGKTIIRAEKENVQIISAKAKALVKKYRAATDDALKEFRSWLRDRKKLSKSEKTYNSFDDQGRVFRSDNMSATDKRRNEKFYVPLLHPRTNQPCPVPNNGWRYTPESINDLLKEDLILFGDDHTTTPRRKSFLEDNTSSQMPTIYFSGGRGKFELDRLGVEFPFAHPTELYSHLIGSVTEQDDLVIDFFAGSGTTGHAVMNLIKDFEERRKLID